LPLALVAPALALSPSSTKYLRSIDIDPKSAQVVSADKDGAIRSAYRGKPVENSLEALAAAHDAVKVRKFIATRDFVKRLKADFEGTPMLRVDYDAMYLTESERDLAFKKFMER
jgi:hypothetical protein